MGLRQWMPDGGGGNVTRAKQPATTLQSSLQSNFGIKPVQNKTYEQAGAPWAPATGVSSTPSTPSTPSQPVPSPVPSPVVSDADFLNADPTVIAQRAAYNKAFEQLIAELDLGKGQYEQDYGTSLKNLGWLDGAGADGKGDWDLQNTATSSGRGFQGLQNDFSSRGMIQGSGYADALENFLKSLGQQKDQLGTARSNFLADNDLKRTQGQQTRDEQIRLAEASALANRASLLTGITGLV